jgi:hypothetical protein
MSIKISYGITVCNEINYIQNLIPFLLENKQQQDEIVILYDSKNGTEEVEEYLRSHSIQNEFRWYKEAFNDDFAEWKNKLNSLCGETDYIFSLDADEMISKDFMTILPEILKNNPEVEFYWVPRENYVLGITQEHIQKWGWKLDKQNRLNYPDFQGRIYRYKPNKIKWSGKVHEKIIGYTHFSTLPDNPIFSINHTKVIERQELQNNFYNSI